MKYYPVQVTPGSSLSGGARTYLTKVPNDPTGNPEYSYIPSPANCDNSAQNCISFCLYAKLEGLVLNSDAGCTPTSPYTYGVTRP